MPIISSRSLNEFNTLKSTGILKENGIKIELGKELLSIATLETMLSNYQKGNLDTSISSAEIFVESCLETLKSLESKSDVPKEDALNTQNVPGDWRIASILAKNFRGLTEWNGEFEFNFDRKPYFLFGLNGSGKTNILGAIIWCLTGMCLKDRCESLASRCE